jgi:hypothetical protein
MSANLPALMDHQAELVDLRHVALELLKEHAKIAAPFLCLCPTCRRASSWVKPVAHP